MAKLKIIFKTKQIIVKLQKKTNKIKNLKELYFIYRKKQNNLDIDDKDEKLIKEFLQNEQPYIEIIQNKNKIQFSLSYNEAQQFFMFWNNALSNILNLQNQNFETVFNQYIEKLSIKEQIEADNTIVELLENKKNGDFQLRKNNATTK